MFQAIIQVASEPTPSGFIAVHYMQSHREVFDFFSSDEITGNQVMKHGWMNCSTGQHWIILTLSFPLNWAENLIILEMPTLEWACAKWYIYSMLSNLDLFTLLPIIYLKRIYLQTYFLLALSRPTIWWSWLNNYVNYIYSTKFLGE